MAKPLPFDGSSDPIPVPAGEPKPDLFPFARDSIAAKVVVWIAILLPIVGTIWAFASLWGSRASPLDLWLMLGGWTLTGLGITLGYHRLLAHKSFQAVLPARVLLIVMGAAALQGRPSDWAATHVKHHARADREGDPHSPVEGLIHSHLGWLLRDRFVRDGTVHDSIRQDPAVRLVDALWGPIALVSIFAPFFIGWGVTGSLALGWQAFLWGSGVRILVAHHITWCVNSLGHVIGTRPHETPDRSRNNMLLALVSWGEGWHNNHHAAPGSPWLGRRWYQVDLGAAALVVMRIFGLVRFRTTGRRASTGRAA